MADSLSFGFFFKQHSTKLINGYEKPLIIGGSLDIILCIALRWGILRYGGSPSHNYIATIPKDQISTF